MFIHGFSPRLLMLGALLVVLTMFLWWRDVIREATFKGEHTSFVQKGLRIGFILFIASEVCFFFSFFWAYFHSALAPTPEIGCVWPPHGIMVPNPFHIPLLNTGILLASGATVTWSHMRLLASSRKESIVSLGLTLALGSIFLGLQGLEYYEMPFTIADSVYGSCFYMLTGFHGLHVTVGVLFLFVCLVRIYRHHFSPSHHVGFEIAIWYWHFVDVVWLFLYVCVYWWPY